MKNYTFDGSISREVLNNYLSRTIGMNTLCHKKDPKLFEEDLKLLRRIRPKLIGRAASVWSKPAEGNDDDHYRIAAEYAARIHEIDPEIVLQGVVFEIAYKPYVDTVPVPAWVFEAFGEPVCERNFRYEDIIFEDGTYHNRYGDQISVPDITRPETKKWVFYRACRYIDAGFEGLHMGQVYLTGAQDKEYRNWKQVMDMIRAYASIHARRHYVICDAHVAGIIVDGVSLFDCNKFPLRLKAVKDQYMECILEPGHTDSILGRSMGGIHPSGWETDSLPFVIEFDAWERSDHPGEYRENSIFAWGHDDLSWFYLQDKEKRHRVLRYLWKYMRDHYPEGWLEIPCCRGACSLIEEEYPVSTWENPNTAWLDEVKQNGNSSTAKVSYTLDENGNALVKCRYYFAHDPSDVCPWGCGDADAICECFGDL